MKRFLLRIALLIFVPVFPLRADFPFDDAIGIWHFADASSSAGSDTPLIPEGDVLFGQPLSEAEAGQSQYRGGDGLVADFSKGGHLTLLPETGGPFDVCGREFTVYMRLRDPSGAWNAPVISRYAADGRPQYRLYATDSFLGSQIGTTNNRKLLFADAPFAEFPKGRGPCEWHDIALRLNGVKLNFFVDGRLYDEDYMLGDLLPGEGPIRIGAEVNENGEVVGGFHGQIDTVALWNRALKNDEILTLAGGPCLADRRQLTDRGDDASLQYWIPPNHYSVGDCMPFYAEGTFHFMFLLDKGHHSSKNALGAHQWIQATSKDLVHWTHQPFLFELERQEEGSFCTGSVFYRNGTYYAYYSDRAFEFPGGDYSAPYVMLGQLAMAVSKDGIHFEKTGIEPILTLPEQYAHTTRDPVVFQNPETGKFHMLFTTSHHVMGCWAQAVSDDLYHWELIDPVYAKRDSEPECPDWFEWGGKYYTIANHSNGYWLWSDSPTGPWDVPPLFNGLMPGNVAVPKTSPYKDGRRIICGWTREYGFGGHAVFHELIRHDDGTLGEKFVPEMVPPTEEPVVRDENFTVGKRVWSIPQADIQIKIRLTYDPEKRDAIRDLYFQFVDDDILKVSSRTRSITLGDYSLPSVDFTSGELELLLVLKGNIADLQVNGDRTLTATFSIPEKRDLYLQTDQEDKWNIELFEVSPLKLQ